MARVRSSYRLLFPEASLTIEADKPYEAEHLRDFYDSARKMAGSGDEVYGYKVVLNNISVVVELRGNKLTISLVGA